MAGYVQVGTCAYLEDRSWALEMQPAPRSDAAYRALLETHHRRSGWTVYRPVCRGCRACVPLRVPVDAFTPSKSQRRAARRNADVAVEVGPLEPTEEKWLLHDAFVRARFGDRDGGFRSLEDYAGSFGASPVTTVEMRYRLGERLVGLGIVDLLPDVVSSVYFYFDPAEARRSLGTFSALREVALARETGRRYLYLGYWIEACREMSYKARFRPCEVLGPDGAWTRLERPLDDDGDAGDPPAGPGDPARARG
ncbi:MAG: arginyltransferase [Planctomycetes bacterium]|nr:arginyltransferase [Planctomycetota bacterium]